MIAALFMTRPRAPQSSKKIRPGIVGCIRCFPSRQSIPEKIRISQLSRVDKLWAPTFSRLGPSILSCRGARPHGSTPLLVELVGHAGLCHPLQPAGLYLGILLETRAGEDCGRPRGNMDTWGGWRIGSLQLESMLRPLCGLLPAQWAYRVVFGS